MDIRRAITFVEGTGTDLEKVRLRHILYGERPGPELLQPFNRLQNADGGYPFEMQAGNISTLNNTQVALYTLDELGWLESATGDRAFEYLLAAQKDDGGWDETLAVAPLGPPPWATPGDLKARHYLTAESAFWLGVRGYRGEVAFRRALEFLLRRRQENGRFCGFLHTTWIATSVFAIAGESHQDVVEKGLQALSAEPFSEWVDSQICWALECFAKAGMPKDEPFIAACLEELVRRQSAEGKWISEDGEARSAATTLGVLRVLKHYHLIE